MTLINDIVFPDAESPWIPTLWDIEKRKAEGRPGYENIGFEHIVVDSSMGNMLTAWSRLGTRFKERYANRMINSETLERWQIRLQVRTDEIIDEYERAYRLYEEYAQEMDNPIEGWTDAAKDTESGTDTVQEGGTVRTADTPNYGINLEDNWGDSVAKRDSSGSTTYGHVLDRTVTRKLSGVRNLEDVIRSFRSWVDLDTAFVAEYENLFLNVFWY